MRPGKSKKCPHCLINIDFSGDDFSKAQKVLDNFEKEINKTLNTLNFKWYNTMSNNDRIVYKRDDGKWVNKTLDNKNASSLHQTQKG